MFRHLIAISLLLAAPVLAQQPPGDGPALGGRGASAVGVHDTIIDLGARPDATRPDGKGGFGSAPRRLAVTLWYPAQAPGGGKSFTTSYRYATTPVDTVPPGSVPAEVAVPGQAGRDAAPAAGRHPLLILSHGFANRALMFSDLAEHLASKGYVVAAIDHGDLADLAVSRPMAFLNNVLHRAADQRLVMAEITRRAASTGNDPWAHIDGSRIALAGYSMGGFGALATAGAAYDPGSPLFAQGPPGTAAVLSQTPSPPPALRALIAFAPWGGAAPLRAFNAAGLMQGKLPSLFIAGDADDVADYAGGIRWLYEHSGGPRTLITYQNARHNVATNATPAELAHRFEYLERQDEPVWRKDRILAINVHFITAFLDWRLKGDAAAERWLTVPTPLAADGTWPLPPGADAGGSTDAPSSHWPGFQRRWALGLKLESRP
jgi:alpha-beta hydrolase superfamily lysophospholipase